MLGVYDCLYTEKQVGCYHKGVVDLVAIMSGLCEVSFGIRDLIALGNQRGSWSGLCNSKVHSFCALELQSDQT